MRRFPHGKSDEDALKRKWEGLTGIPSSYVEMAGQIREESAKGGDRPLKRRKGKQKVVIQEPIIIDDDDDEEDKASQKVFLPSKVDESSSESEYEDDEDEDDDDEEWEAVDLQGDNDNDNDNDTQEITVSLDPAEPKKKVKKRKLKNTLSKEERNHRIMVHKIHLMALLHHVYMRNKWCSSYTLRNAYKSFLSNTIKQELHPPEHLSSTLKTRKFLDGLRHAGVAWKKRFRLSDRGTYMVPWNEVRSKDRKVEKALSFSTFHRRLLSFRGNRDLAAQGFCALLRANDIETRLVCSLQPLDFLSSVKIDDPIGVTEHNISEYPTFWIEAWDKWAEKWVTLDPIVTSYVDVIRPSTRPKLEPPASDKMNQMRYVVALDQSLKATDVTRRYTQSYTTKVRKKRVEAIEEEESTTPWWTRVMSKYAPPPMRLTQRDVDEERELQRREENEGMPTSIQDFKNHPVYLLERHLRKDEVLVDRTSCGLFSIGKGSSKATVPVYLRKHVKKVKSAQRWFRYGRIIKPSQQPLKYATKKKNEELTGGEDEAGAALYSIEQTEVYVPEPVQDGVVPKNGFGNIDIYTPSMIPKGAVHLPGSQIAVAAKLLGIDYADAVTGFTWANRKMNPKIEGIIAAAEYKEAVEATYEWLLEEQEQAHDEERRLRALLMWRKYLVALRIQDRLNKTHGEVTSDSKENGKEQENDADDESDGEGGFMSGSDQGGGFFSDDGDDSGVVNVESTTTFTDSVPLGMTTTESAIDIDSMADGAEGAVVDESETQRDSQLVLDVPELDNGSSEAERTLSVSLPNYISVPEKSKRKAHSVEERRPQEDPPKQEAQTKPTFTFNETNDESDFFPSSVSESELFD